MRDVSVNGSWHNVFIFSPDGIQDVVAAHNLTPMASQEPQQIEFEGRQIDELTALPGLIFPEVDFNVVKLEPIQSLSRREPSPK